MEKKKIKGFINNYAVLIILVLLIVVFGLINSNFFTFDNAMNVLRQASIIGLMGVGMSVTFLAGGFDLSIGSVVSLTTILGAKLMSSEDGFGLDPALALIITFIVCLAIGFLNGLIITKTNMPPLIATLSTSTIISGFSLMICGGKGIYGLPESIKFIGQGYIGPIPVPGVILILFMIVTSLVLNKTFFGRYIYAVGSNNEVARLSGINTDHIKIITYIICSGFSCLAGIILLSRLFSGQPEIGATFPMLVITACVAGGVSISGGQGAMLKAFIGIMLVSVLSNGFTILKITQYWQSVTQGAILVLAVGMDSIQKKGKISKAST